jgi:beta-ring hydroxylase
MGVQVEMTTGATIHTTDGLKMTVTKRIKPPIVPVLEMPTLKMDSSISLSKGDTLLCREGEVSSPHS